MRRRLDLELVRRGLAPSRERAQAEIASGRVRVSGAVAAKPARLVAPAEPLEVVGPPPPFVSRGGEKLDAALARFGVPVAGRRAVDAGASTGGFTDCLLQRGAAAVVAVDVGHGQLDARLRGDPRVDVRERTNIRDVRLDRPAHIVVADLAFVSVRSVAPALAALVAPGGDLIVLIKPQFEVGRMIASRGRGVVRDPAAWQAAVEGAIGAFAAAGMVPAGLMVSPITGRDGNVEFLGHFRNGPATGVPNPDVAEVIAAAMARP